MNVTVQKIINILGWILFGIIYTGVLVLALWWLFDRHDGSGIWNSLSIISKIGITLLGAGALVVYTIIMFFLQMSFEQLWLILLKKFLSRKAEINTLRKKVEEDTKNVNKPKLPSSGLRQGSDARPEDA
jgi:predicted membrane protein